MALLDEIRLYGPSVSTATHEYEPSELYVHINMYEITHHGLSYSYSLHI